MVVINALLAAGAKVVAYDPEAMEEAKHSLGERIIYAESRMHALQEADALLLITEWNEFRNPDWNQVASTMPGRHIFDGRNIYDPVQLNSAGFTYHGIGRLT